MCGYATNTQGDVQGSTSTLLRGCAGKYRHWGMWTVKNQILNLILPIFPHPFGSWEFGVTQFQECWELFETLWAGSANKISDKSETI